jgi:hypothetical protein
MCISTRTNTVAFLMSIDLWQSVLRHSGSSDGSSFLSEVVHTRPTKCRNVRNVDSSAGGLLLSFKLTSTRVNGSKHSKHNSGSEEVTKLASARSAVCTISNGASCVHFTHWMMFRTRDQQRK